MPTDLRDGVARLRAGTAAACALALAVVLLSSAAPARAAEESAGAEPVAAKEGADWASWHANNNVADMASVQRGARNFVSYCLGCHSLKYERWSRLGQDLDIPKALLAKDLIPPGETAAGYVISPMSADDAEKWFGKAPPD